MLYLPQPAVPRIRLQRSVRWRPSISFKCSYAVIRHGIPFFSILIILCGVCYIFHSFPSSPVSPSQNNPSTGNLDPTRFAVLSLLLGFCTAETILDEKCRPVKNTMLTCLDSTAGDLPKTVNKEIEWLIFTRSNVPVLQKQHLENFPSLTDLHLKDANLEKLEDDAFSASKALSWVDVSINKLTTLSPNIFQNCPEVYYFNVSYNPNLVIPKNAPFLNAPQLKWLLIQGAGVKELYPETFSKLPGLKFLSLSDNELTTIPSNLFQPLKHLNSLDLSRNQFKTITIDLDTFRTIALYLQDNPWECDCALFPTIEWAKNHRIKDDVRCLKPENKKWQEINNLSCPQIAAH